MDALDAIEELIDICLNGGDHETVATACHRESDFATAVDSQDQLTRFEHRIAEIKP